MTQPDLGARTLKQKLIQKRDTIRRAFAEFLAVPTVMVTGFLLLALALYALDRGKLDSLDPIRGFLTMGAIAAGIITVTSITISLLLLAVQQGAGSMTSAVFDQFLRRRLNQVYFGFFIGLALYSLVTLATVHESSNAVLGATLGFLLTIVALFLLIVLLYSTINQMRPVVIIGAIRDHALRARIAQRPFLLRTLRTPTLDGGPVTRLGQAGNRRTRRIRERRTGVDDGTNPVVHVNGRDHRNAHHHFEREPVRNVTRACAPNMNRAAAPVEKHPVRIQYVIADQPVDVDAEVLPNRIPHERIAGGRIPLAADEDDQRPRSTHDTGMATVLMPAARMVRLTIRFCLAPMSSSPSRRRTALWPSVWTASCGTLPDADISVTRIIPDLCAAPKAR